MTAKIRANLVLPLPIHARLAQIADEIGGSLSAAVGLVVKAYDGRPLAAPQAPQRPGTPTPSHATGPAAQPPGIPKRPPFDPRKIDGRGKHLIGGPEHRALLIWRIVYSEGVRNVDGSPVPTMPEDEATRYVDEVMLPDIVANTPEQLRMPAEVVEAERAQTALWIKQMEARE